MFKQFLEGSSPSAPAIQSPHEYKDSVFMRVFFMLLYDFIVHNFTIKVKFLRHFQGYATRNATRI
jgi:hypothetical protein